MVVHSTSEPNLDRRAFRDALARYATGVAVVMARAPDGRVAGMTINSFASVSLDPPLVLWSMQRGTASASVYHAAAGFSVSILGCEQELVARSFAKTHGAKLDSAELAETASGMPRLANPIAWFDCRVAAVHPGGDHDIFVGKVIDFGMRPGATLLFHDGRFGASGA